MVDEYMPAIAKRLQCNTWKQKEQVCLMIGCVKGHELGLRFSFGTRALTEMKIWYVEGNASKCNLRRRKGC